LVHQATNGHPKLLDNALGDLPEKGLELGIDLLDGVV
jgi:hypothetical protein